MAKLAAINGATAKTNFFLIGRRRTIALTYASVFVFVVFTILLAITSSSNLFSSTWCSTSAAEFCESHFTSVYYYFFRYSSAFSQFSNTSETEDAGSQPTFIPPTPLNGSQNRSQIEGFDAEIEVSEPMIEGRNSTVTPSVEKEIKQITVQNSTVSSTNDNESEIVETRGEKEIKQIPVQNSTVSAKKSNNESEIVKIRGIDPIESLRNCDMFDGDWIVDNSYPLYEPGSCPLIDEQFNCFLNGRPDSEYYKLKWKPKGCSLPRLDGNRMLKLLRGKRLVFVGDSLNRNMWESLICILRNSVKNKKKVYEQSGKQQFRSDSSFSFIFEDYNLTVEFFVTPFLVQEWEVTDKNGTKKETLRIDLIRKLADEYKNADIIVFNTGHWWTHEKTSAGKDYYQEGSHVYSDLNVLEAFRRALTTWGRWIDANVDPMKSLVFFRGYSASHFGGGQWNSGGACDNETEPIKLEKYLTSYPTMSIVLENVLQEMKSKVSYLNVTRMTDYRKDGHPSVYRKVGMTEEQRRSELIYQDCSHWCLPGVPDTWNEILYAQLLVKLRR